MRTVQVNPKSNWAKNRVRQHGNVFLVKDERIREGEPQMLLESLDKTWTLCEGMKMHWCGWFGSKDAEIIEKDS
jgi:hypothetical protein